ncbi:MAG: NADH-quinone oxidoreductase subunit I [Deltaproteobacteria bacterium]|nr:NADH-quinone oxidoreductase subunit I [Deltaproteobacteria bacterium]
MGYWKEIVEGGWSLVEGMRVTVRRLCRPVVTVQYPRKQLNLSPAYRGHIEFKRFPDTGTHKCIACGACQRACPSHVIKVQGVKAHLNSAKTATHYFIDFSRCSLCGLCVETCPTKTLQYSREYELEGESRLDSIVDLMARLEQRNS